MGFYINPSEGTKEDWLHEHGEPFHNHRWPPDSGKTIICLVFNPHYTAAAIAFSEEEFEEFNNPQDPRVKLWYQAPMTDVVAVCPSVGEKLSQNTGKTTGG